MDPIAEIKRLYYQATPATVARHLARAITLLKELPTEEDRERAAVFMDGLSQMRSEWAGTTRDGTSAAPSRKPPVPTSKKRPSAGRNKARPRR
jgi:hypothetical protein